MNLLILLIRWLLIFTAFSPLIVTKYTIFPYIFGKTMFFRSLIELILILVCLYLAALIYGGNILKINVGFLRHPLVIVLVLFFISLILSTIFATNPYRAFWGDVARSEGFWTLLHFGLFLIFILVFFERGDWMRFIKASLVSGFLVSSVAILQFLNADFLPGWIGKNAFRPGSFFENPAFMSSFLIFIIGFGIFVFYKYKNTTSKFWIYFSLLTSIASLFAIFFSRTRGAILGILTGFLFLCVYLAWDNNFRFKNIFRIFLFISVIVGCTFLVTKNTLIWQKIPGLDRLARLNLQDDSLQTRLISMGSSWRAFLEKPVLGWGLENYKVAYNKYYNPRYARYAETWFDRAHNALIDRAVMQGVAGFITYLGLWIVLFYYLLRKFDGGGVILAATLAAYFVNNLFLFDMPMGYLMMFFIIGFVIKDSTEIQWRLNRNSIEIDKYIVSAVSFGFITLMIYVFYFYNFIPYRQMSIYRKAMNTTIGEKILEASPKFLWPYNYSQATIRFFLMDALYNSGLFSKKEFEKLNDVAINALNTVVEKERGYEPRHQIILAESLNERAKYNESVFKLSKSYLEDAKKFSPLRQDIYYLLSYVASGEGRNKDAIGIAREAVGLDPGVAKAHFNLGLNLALAGRDYWGEVEKELLETQRLGFVWMPLLPKDKRNMEIIYKKMIEAYIIERDIKSIIRVVEQFRGIADEVLKDDLNSLIDLAKKGKWQDIEIVFSIKKEDEPTREEYISLLYKYVKERDVKKLIAIAERFKEILVDPTGKEELDLLMDLAKKGNWEIIENTFIEK